MSTVIASITTSVDGYVTGPDDRPGQGLGVGTRLFEGFEHDVDLAIDRTYTSPLATHVWYSVR